MIRRYLDASLIVTLAASPAWSSTATYGADGQNELPFLPKWSVPANGKVLTKPNAPAAAKQNATARATSTVSTTPPRAAAQDNQKPIRLHLTDPAAAYPDLGLGLPSINTATAAGKSPAADSRPARRAVPLAAIPFSATIPEPDAKVLLQPHSVLPLPKVFAPRATALTPPVVLALPAAPKAPGVISAQISLWDSPTVTKIVDNIVDEHFAKDPTAQKLDQQVKHYRGKVQVVMAKAKDSLNYSTDYQGMGPSKRMGQLVLCDKAKVRDATTAEYERQKYVDKIHGQVIASMMEISMGLGMPDPNRREEIISSGLHSLDVLVGEDQSKVAYSALKSWIAKHGVPESVFKIPVWDTIEREEKLNTILQSAAERDTVVADLKVHVSKYANIGKVKLTTSTMIESTLNGITMLAPGFAIPIGAGAALNAYVMSTGGSEEGKIEKELVYDKRIQSRMKVLNQEASLALDNYRFAMVTHNAPLLAFSQALVAEMSSNDVAGKIFSAPIAQDAPDAVPEMKPSKHKIDDDDDDA